MFVSLDACYDRSVNSAPIAPNASETPGSPAEKLYRVDIFELPILVIRGSCFVLYDTIVIFASAIRQRAA